MKAPSLTLSSGSVKLNSVGETRVKMRRLALVAGSLAILISVLASAPVGAQSSKGGSQSSSGRPSNGPNGSYAPAATAAPSPVSQMRQQQQQGYGAPQGSLSRLTNGGNGAAATKRRQQQQQQAIQQQQMADRGSSYSSQRGDDAPGAATEDPLADSEPALYGSVAGTPGVDFPAYTRIPKTSFTCEGKGFEFGFYADEEAQCQVYHVCWSGRRESFLCGVGTVFNQAILACDYWHSVDCSKSSQFYGVNSELGKAGAEPAISGGQGARTSAQLPSSASSNLAGGSGANAGYGELTNQRVGGSGNRLNVPTQQQQYSPGNDDFDAPQQQQQQQQPQQQQMGSYARPAAAQAGGPQNGASYGNGGPATFAPPRSQSAAYDYGQPQKQQQRVSMQSIARDDSPPTKSSRAQATTTLAPVAATAVKRNNNNGNRYNMDYNPKVNSLIDSPVRSPIKSSPAGAVKQRNQQPQQQQKQQPTPNFAQMAVARAQQSGSQALNPGLARKGNNGAESGSSSGYSPRQQLVAQPKLQPQQQPQPQLQQQQQQQEQQDAYDNETDSEPQQQQQSSFDDTPVQTSTANYNLGGRQLGGSTALSATPSSFMQQQTIVSGGSGDGSSAITMQYDTIGPASQGNGAEQQSSYEQNDESARDDDFRSSGARAAASHNQNWYIMRSI